MRFVSRAVMGLFAIGLSVAVLVLGASPYLGCMLPGSGLECASKTKKRKAPSARAEREFAVRLGEIELTDMRPQVEAFGEIMSGRTLALRAPLAGRLLRVSDSFREGAGVSAGQVLVAIDAADPEARKADAAAALAEAQASLAQAREAVASAQADWAAAVGQRDLRRKAYERQEQLGNRGFSTAASIETAELALAEAERAVITRDQARTTAQSTLTQAEQQVARARIALDDATRDLGETEVLAPFDGVLSGVDATIGRLVNTNEELGELIDTAALEVGFRVSYRDFARLIDDRGRLKDAEVNVTLDFGERHVSARASLERVSAQVDTAQGGRQVFARLLPEDGAVFRPGDFVSVSVREPVLRDVAVLPRSAVSEAGVLLILDPENRLEAVTVSVLRRQGERVVIGGADLAGLVGKRFVVERLPQLGQGVKVRDLSAPEPDAAADAPARDRS
ncbi:MAG: HlyD family efflux transporter periplasmic adaptor subunit [Neomegalonema sp.]|nr:HlyD family efflux transporter periplasmic adaptor subunit [Neomegalonema sp.]